MGVERILALSALEQKISLLFLDAGIFHIKKNQNPGLIQREFFTEMFKAYQWHEIEEVNVMQKTMQTFNTTICDLTIPAQILNCEKLKVFFERFDVIFKF